MRRILAVALALVAAPAFAAPNTAAFQRYCEAKVPVATCGCMADEMARTRQGQVALDALRVFELPKDRQPAAAKAIADKYSMKLSEVAATLNGIEPYIKDVAGRCI